jgi:hypothetical protein
VSREVRRCPHVRAAFRPRRRLRAGPLRGRDTAADRPAPLYGPFTRQFLTAAGVTSGTKVLDVGGRAGDVPLLVAELVGPEGQVVGWTTPPPGAPGPDPQMGLRLFSTFLRAGLPAPKLRRDVPMGGGPAGLALPMWPTRSTASCRSWSGSAWAGRRGHVPVPALGPVAGQHLPGCRHLPGGLHLDVCELAVPPDDRSGQALGGPPGRHEQAAASRPALDPPDDATALAGGSGRRDRWRRPVPRPGAVSSGSSSRVGSRRRGSRAGPPAAAWRSPP